MPTLFDSPDAQALMECRDKPDPKKYLGYLRDDILDWWSLGYFAKMQKCYRTRMCWHPGKQDDGQYGDDSYGTRKKYPYPGALDHDMRLADQLINELVQAGMTAWDKSEKIVRPRDAMNDEQNMKAQSWKHALDFELDQTRNPLRNALELFLNCVGEFGQGIIFEGWEKRWRLGKKTIDWNDLVDSVMEDAANQARQQTGQDQIPTDVAQQIQNDVLMNLSVMIQNEEYDSDIIQRLQAYDMQMPDKEAKRVIKAFRNGQMNDVVYYAPVPVTDRPIHTAIIPGVDGIWPLRCEFENMTRFWHFPWVTEAAIRVAVAQDEWDTAWAEEVLSRGTGQCIELNTIGGGSAFAGWELNGVDMGLQLASTQALKNSGMYQLAVMYHIEVTAAGLPAVYRTILHSGSQDKYASHECDYSGNGKMPFVRCALERTRNIDASPRGIPELVLTNQLGLKILDDGITAQSELRSNPPKVTTIDGGADGLRPGGTLRAKTNEMRVGGGAAFMEVPDVSEGTLKGRENLLTEADAYFCRSVEMDPEIKYNRRTWLMHKFCASFEQILELMCGNMQMNVETLNIGSVGGQAINKTVKGEDLQGELDITVRAPEELEALVKKLEAYNELVLPNDRSGLTDWAYNTRFLTQKIFPELAQFVSDPQVATTRIINDEKQMISQIIAGVPLAADDFKGRIDNPQLRLQQWQLWGQTPGNQQRMMQDETLQENVQKRVEGLQFQITQYQENAQTGRIGVKIDDPNQGMGAMQQPALMGAQ